MDSCRVLTLTHPVYEDGQVEQVVICAEKCIRNTKITFAK